MRDTRQATQLELQEARTRDRAPTDDGPFAIPEPVVTINRDPVDAWLRTYRQALTAPPVPACAHCGRHPRLAQTWKPWHPQFALLCGPCRSGSVLTAHIVRDRTGRSIYAFLDDLMHVLALPNSEPD